MEKRRLIERKADYSTPNFEVVNVQLKENILDGSGNFEDLNPVLW